MLRIVTVLVLGVLTAGAVHGAAEDTRVEITSVACSESNGRIQVAIQAATTLNNYQKPEQDGSTLIIRFPNARLSSDAVITSCKGLTIKTVQIREFLLVKITSSYSWNMQVLRTSPSSVAILQSEMAATPPVQQNKADASAWALDVIVIDAGHGGKDVGAKGVNGVYEKDVTLAIAKKLRSLIRDEFPQTKVVMTRDSDVFVELFRRTQIANEAKGKLFVSIHCNSMPTIPHSAHGCETYILRPGRNEDAALVAERENASVKLEGSADRYAGLDADKLIVATMAQRSFVRFSEDLASKIQRSVSKRTGLQDRGVNQAGFFVLVGASMPNVLVETAFLSNPDDAEFISSANGQAETAKGILWAITEYARVYQSSLQH